MSNLRATSCLVRYWTVLTLFFILRAPGLDPVAEQRRCRLRENRPNIVPSQASRDKKISHSGRGVKYHPFLKKEGAEARQKW
jgi:hypothetical protein